MDVLLQVDGHLLLLCLVGATSRLMCVAGNRKMARWSSKAQAGHCELIPNLWSRRHCKKWEMKMDLMVGRSSPFPRYHVSKIPCKKICQFTVDLLLRSSSSTGRVLVSFHLQRHLCERDCWDLQCYLTALQPNCSSDKLHLFHQQALYTPY